MIRSAYALGGLGSGLCYNEEKLRDMATRVGFDCDAIINSVWLIDRQTDRQIDGDEGRQASTSQILCHVTNWEGSLDLCINANFV